MMVEYEEQKLTEEDIIKAVEQGGYGAKVHGSEKAAVSGENIAQAEMDSMKKDLSGHLYF